MALRQRLTAALLCCAASACGSASTEGPTAGTGAAGTEGSSFAIASPAPISRDAFLKELLPLWDIGTVVVVYDVRGPAGLQGTVEVLARGGGYRRDNWRLTLPLPDAEPVEITGSTIQTPDLRWSRVGDQAPQARALSLGGLADAYVRAAPSEREVVIEAVRGWHRTLAQGRAEQPGSRGRVLGIDCLDARAGSQQLCVWEETGLPLRYEGAAFSLVAKHVERDVELGPHAFDVPDGFDVPGQAPPHNGSADPAATLRALAGGDVAILAVVTQPGLRLPDPDAVLGG